MSVTNQEAALSSMTESFFKQGQERAAHDNIAFELTKEEVEQIILYHIANSPQATESTAAHQQMLIYGNIVWINRESVMGTRESMLDILPRIYAKRKMMNEIALEHNLELLLSPKFGMYDTEEVLATYATPISTMILLTQRVAESKGTIDKDAVWAEFLVGVGQWKEAQANYDAMEQASADATASN